MRNFIIPVFFVWGIMGAHFAAHGSCFSAFTVSRGHKLSQQERTWNFVSEAVSEYSTQSYSDTLKDLSWRKKRQLKKLLKSYNPETDFLIYNNSSKFLDKLKSILEGSIDHGDLLFLEKNPEFDRMVLRAYQIEQGADSLTKVAQDSIKSKSVFSQRVSRLVAYFKGSVIYNLLGLSPLPYWHHKRGVLDDALTDYGPTTDLVKLKSDRGIVLELVRRDAYLSFRKAVKYVTAGVLAVFIYHHTEAMVVGYGAEWDRQAYEAVEEHWQEKSMELSEESLRLEGLKKSREFFENDPVFYFELSLSEQFRALYGRAPMGEELVELKELAVKIVRERRQSQK